eukprot:3702863-Karenia_brevis.AAC.1
MGASEEEACSRCCRSNCSARSATCSRLLWAASVGPLRRSVRNLPRGRRLPSKPDTQCVEVAK